MTLAQSAILPEAGPFALYVQLKINQNRSSVLQQLKQLATTAEELNRSQPGAALTVSVAFSKAFWSYFTEDAPEELVDFPTFGQGAVVAPATDVDVLIHLHSTRHDLHFYLFRQLMNHIVNDVDVIDETYGYRYLDSRDMTDFVDGTENPKEQEREEVAIVPEGKFAGGSYVMAQRYEHNLPAWNRLNIAAQEKVIGRTKPDSVQLDNVAPASHVGRVDLKEDGKGVKIVRHSLPYGSVSGPHGLLFIAYCKSVHNFDVLLKSMFGDSDGKTDQLLRFTHPVTGAYFFAPSQPMLAQLTIE